RKEADGPQTDIGGWLKMLNERHGAKNIRSVFLLSDGAHNGPTKVTPEAQRWADKTRINTFMLGKEITSNKQKDAALLEIAIDPEPVPVKGRMIATVTVDPGVYEGEEGTFTIKIDDDIVDTRKLRLEKKNKAQKEFVFPLEVDAPARPGEYRLTVELAKMKDEVNTDNNKIETFFTATKDGLSVLYVQGRMSWEATFIKRAMAGDKRIRLFEVNRLSDDNLGAS